VGGLVGHCRMFESHHPQTWAPNTMKIMSPSVVCEWNGTNGVLKSLFVHRKNQLKSSEDLTIKWNDNG